MDMFCTYQNKSHILRFLSHSFFRSQTNTLIIEIGRRNVCMCFFFGEKNLRRRKKRMAFERVTISSCVWRQYLSFSLFLSIYTRFSSWQFWRFHEKEFFREPRFILTEVKSSSSDKDFIEWFIQLFLLCVSLHR